MENSGEHPVRATSHLQDGIAQQRGHRTPLSVLMSVVLSALFVFLFDVNDRDWSAGPGVFVFGFTVEVNLAIVLSLSQLRKVFL